MKNDNWIKCSDSLPGYEEKVFLSCREFVESNRKDGYSKLYVLVGSRVSTSKHGESFSVSGGELYYYRKNDHDLKEVTHWMPLPTPPEEGG